MALASSSLERGMKVLALDTTAWACSVALWEEGRELAFEEETTERAQAAILPVLVKKIIDNHKIDLLLVNIGPGSFTGIRVGLAFAKGLSMGLNIPLKGMDSFTATYISLEPTKDVLILIEAHRQDVFARRYYEGKAQNTESLARKDIEQILSKSPDLLIAGSASSACLEGLSYQKVSSSWRGARALAHAFFRDPSSTTDPLPFYAREADVTYAHSSFSS
jgi:tRNA threonylcarbamoyladenosine biosynthesis protein TsaB